MSFECPPKVSVTLLVTVVCRQYAIPDTVSMRKSEAIHAHSCERAA
jgi:hypothetical protein